MTASSSSWPISRAEVRLRSSARKAPSPCVRALRRSHPVHTDTPKREGCRGRLGTRSATSPPLSSRVCNSVHCAMDARINHALVKTRPVARMFCCSKPSPGNLHLEIVRPSAMAYNTAVLQDLTSFYLSFFFFFCERRKSCSVYFSEHCMSLVSRDESMCI